MTWKNGTFVIGVLWLIWGALFLDYPDWDIGVSVIMAISSYFTAEYTWKYLTRALDRNLKDAIPVLFFTWWSVDGSYWAYWTVVNPSVMIREGQWLMSLCLYLLCGIVWSLVPAQQSLLDTTKLGFQLVKTWWSRTFTNNT